MMELEPEELEILEEERAERGPVSSVEPVAAETDVFVVVGPEREVLFRGGSVIPASLAARERVPGVWDSSGWLVPQSEPPVQREADVVPRRGQRRT